MTFWSNFVVGLLFVITSKTAQSQECALFSRGELESLLSSSLPSALLTRDPNTVCLASGTQRDRYRSASVFVTYSSDGVDGEQVSQLDLTCSNSGDWEINVVSVSTTATASTTLRSDCGSCSANSNDPSFDNVTHCVPCLDSCGGLRQCTGFFVTDCCNVYVNDSCAVQCPAGTGADASTAYTCIDPCSSSPCANNGICSPELPNGASFSCSCVGSWRGSTCGSCTIADCKVCSQTSGVCSECNEGFDKLTGVCACSSICQNGEMVLGQCICNCSAGYSGSNCEVGGPVQCTVENCQTCRSNYSDICETCVGGYQQDEDGSTCLQKNLLSQEAVIGIAAAGAFAVLLLCILTLVGFFCCCKNKGATFV